MKTAAIIVKTKFISITDYISGIIDNNFSKRNINGYR